MNILIKEELKNNEKIKKKLEVLKEHLMIEELEKKAETIRLKMEDPNFWKDVDNSLSYSIKLDGYQKTIDSFSNLKRQIESIDLILTSMINVDQELLEMIKEEKKQIEEEMEKLETESLFNDDFDEENAIIEINPGAGGVDAQDWAEMLMNMYLNWAIKENAQVEILNHLKAEEAGIKNFTAIIKKRYAFGLLKSEKGVHRLVRQSPFDSAGRRHTSFASVQVSPLIENANKIEIKENEIKIETFRSSGAGGQHVNTTDSAVRITHFETGIVVSCQSQRSQIKNKEQCLKILQSKIYELKKEEEREKLKKIKGEQKNIEWGSQIRNYVFFPYNLVKDVRSNYQTSDIIKVMEGNINEFMKAYLIFNKKKEQENERN